MREGSRAPRRRRKRLPAARNALCCVCVGLSAVCAPPAGAAVRTQEPVAPHAQAGEGASSLEAAAAKAGNVGRAVAMSLIGLALAVAATVLAFRRDFKEAGGLFAVGVVAVLLATPVGVALLRDTVASLFGSP